MIQLLLQVTHLGKQGVVIGIRVCHLFGYFVESIEQRQSLGNAFLHIFEDIFLLVQWRLLQQNSHAITRGQKGFTVRGSL